MQKMQRKPITIMSLYSQYQSEIKSKLATELGIDNVMVVPKLIKIVINTGLGEALANKKVIEEATKQFATISGQKPVVTHARHDISSFKVRRADAIGLKVTLRKKMMYDFFEKLVKIVLPRLRDFRGVKESGFDGKGNYTLGLTEQIVFSEIDYSEIDKIRGLEITFVTTAKDKNQTKKLLEMLGLPFTRSNRDQGKHSKK